MSLNTPANITNKYRELQHVRSNRNFPTSAQDTLHSQQYLFPSNLSGWARKLKAISIYDSPEALGTLQVQKIAYCETFMYLDIMIGQIRPTVSYPLATQLVDYNWLSHSPWSYWELLDNISSPQIIPLAYPILLSNIYPISSRTAFRLE